MIGAENLAKIPNKTERLGSLLEAPPNVGDFYGSRMKGWLVPPVTSDYEFFIASGGNGELWLSSDDHPDNKDVVCHQPIREGVENRNWFKYVEQKSAPIPLVEGQVYYYEVRVLHFFMFV